METSKARIMVPTVAGSEEGSPMFAEDQSFGEAQPILAQPKRESRDAGA